MKPVDFEEKNITFAEDQPEYLPLPAHHAHDGQGNVTTVWELTDEEIQILLRTKQIRLNQMTFNMNLQPLLPFVKPDALQMLELEKKYEVPVEKLNEILFNLPVAEQSIAYMHDLIAHIQVKGFTPDELIDELKKRKA